MGASTHITLLNVYKYGTIFSDSYTVDQRTNWEKKKDAHDMDLRHSTIHWLHKVVKTLVVAFSHSSGVEVEHDWENM